MEKNIIISQHPRSYLSMTILKNNEKFNNDRIAIFNTSSLLNFVIDYKNIYYFTIYTIINNKKYYLNFKSLIDNNYDLCYCSLTNDKSKADSFVLQNNDLLYLIKNENDIVPLSFYELHVHENNNCYSVNVLLCTSKNINEISNIKLIDVNHYELL